MSNDVRPPHCPKHLLPNCPVCPAPEPARGDPWVKVGYVLGSLVGWIGRVLADIFEWVLYGAVFGTVVWVGGDLMGVHPGWKVIGGGMIVFRAVILATHSAWTSAVKANSKVKK